jgi:hypothetical protein
VTRSPEIVGTSIVVVGSFNPAIFSPDWFYGKKLLGQSDCEYAQSAPSLVVAHEVSSFETDWFTLQVTQDRFALNTKTTLNPALADLAIGALSLLNQTPVTAVGLNFVAHYKMETEDDFHKIGDVIVPKGPWAAVFPEDEYNVGLATLVLRVDKGPRVFGKAADDAINITLQGSSRVKYGIAFAYNDHHVVPKEVNEGQTPAEYACDEALGLFANVIDRVLEA